MTTPEAGPRAARATGRLFGGIVVLLLAAAIVLWGSSRATWVSQVVEGLPGPRTNTADGAAAEPVLVPWALLCLAAVGGLLATSGWGRRVVGTLVAVAGLWALLRGVAGLADPASEALPIGVRPGDRPLPAEAVLAGPSLGVLGGALMLVAGLLAARFAAVLPRLGARYDAPTRRAGDGATAVRTTPADPDRALWEALDEGYDPTGEPRGEPADRPAGRAPDPPGGRASGRPDGVGGTEGVAG
ncbi:TIGR02234 family membrane protein [Actinomycetospora sp. CA-101289]|uniref:TIGR02234 family membrane protein n=1 Tax=Actinomycetospora sp. CA-101289 TaxID=3239893 RepID=UPI003D95F488